MPWINKIELPDELIDAQQNGTLVLFAGAGVSMDPPALLPSFAGLADQIAAGALKWDGKEALDLFLGRCAERDVKVEERARKILDVPTSAPTELHSDLMSLFDFTTAANSYFGAHSFPNVRRTCLAPRP